MVKVEKKEGRRAWPSENKLHGAKALRLGGGGRHGSCLTITRARHAAAGDPTLQLPEER